MHNFLNIFKFIQSISYSNAYFGLQFVDKASLWNLKAKNNKIQCQSYRIQANSTWIPLQIQLFILGFQVDIIIS